MISSFDGCYGCSGLPPASTLFTDSEASSEAEEDRAGAAGHAQAHSTSIWSHQVTDEGGMQAANKSPLQHQQANSTDVNSAHAVEPASEKGRKVCWVAIMLADFLLF